MESTYYTTSDETTNQDESPSPQHNGRDSHIATPQSQGELIIVSEANARGAKSAPAALQAGSEDDYTLLLHQTPVSPQKLVTPVSRGSPGKPPFSKQKTVHFETEPEFIEPSSMARRKGLDLKARLYDRPQDAQVFQTVRKAKQDRHREHSPNKPGAPLPPIPRPPSGSRVPAPGNALRTTFFKRDQTRIRMRRQAAKKTEEAKEDSAAAQETPKYLD